MLPQSEMSRLVVFRGNSKDTVTAEAWAEMVDRHISVLNWTTKQTAGAAIESMRDDANIWRENLANSSDTDKRNLLEDWNAMKAVFLKRFGKAKTRAAKVQGLGQLRQATGETCGAYQDRVVHTLDKLTTAKMQTCDGVNQKKGFTDCRDLFETAIFLNGLKGDLRMYVEMDLKDTTTTEEVYEMARATEIAVNSKNNQHKVGAVTSQQDHSMETLRGEVSELKRSMDQGHVAAASDRRSNNNKPKVGQRDKPMSDRRPMLCWKCKQWGKHLSKECKLTAEEVARLTPMSKDDRPTGTVVDTQYPNA